ncbi:unnamed protein product, partial [Musa acuminata var. zebrina]
LENLFLLPPADPVNHEQVRRPTMKARTLKRRLVSKKNQASLKIRRFHFTIGYKKPKTTPAFDGKTGEERRRQERR